MMLRVKLWAIAIGSIIVALVPAYFRFRVRQEATEIQHENEVNEYVETRKRVDKTPTLAEPDSAREWLRNRNQ